MDGIKLKQLLLKFCRAQGLLSLCFHLVKKLLHPRQPVNKQLVHTTDTGRENVENVRFLFH